MNTLALGPIVSKVTSYRELTSALIGVLRDFDVEKANYYTERLNETKSTYVMAGLVRGLRHQLNLHAPEFAYVGHRIDDDFAWGVWVDLGKMHEAEEKGQLIQTSCAANTKGRAPYLLEVNEKGVSLFRRKGLERLWEVA